MIQADIQLAQQTKTESSDWKPRIYESQIQTPGFGEAGAMTTNMNVLGKLHILETLYRAGYQSEVIERAIDKLIALEQDRVRHELIELKLGVIQS